MPGGSLDPNGVWLYGEDDERDTFSELLNIGQDSVSDAIGSDRARIAGLESSGALSGAVSSGIVSASSGWSVGPTVSARRKAGVVWARIDFTRTGGALAVTAGTGDIVDIELGTFNAGWMPATGPVYPFTLVTRIGGGFITERAVNLTYLGPNSTLNTGEVVRALCSYPLG